MKRPDALRKIRTICQRFPENIRVRRFTILIKELHPDDGELTRTRKVRRGFVYERYRALIEDIYQDKSEHDLDIEIHYEDGRASRLTGTVAIQEVQA